jgi:hypothetical protein
MRAATRFAFNLFYNCLVEFKDVDTGMCRAVDVGVIKVHTGIDFSVDRQQNKQQ